MNYNITKIFHVVIFILSIIDSYWYLNFSTSYALQSIAICAYLSLYVFLYFSCISNIFTLYMCAAFFHV